MVNKLAKRCYPLLQLLFHSEKSVLFAKPHKGNGEGSHSYEFTSVIQIQ